MSIDITTVDGIEITAKTTYYESGVEVRVGNAIGRLAVFLNDLRAALEGMPLVEREFVRQLLRTMKPTEKSRPSRLVSTVSLSLMAGSEVVLWGYCISFGYFVELVWYVFTNSDLSDDLMHDPRIGFLVEFAFMAS